MLIGLISDTHNILPEKIFNIFEKVDYIIHAGDVGSADILNELETIAPVKAVYGNMDSFPLVSDYNRMETFSLGGWSFCLIHAISSPRSFAYELFKMQKEIDIVIFGHTHQKEHTVFNEIQFINPGSASKPRHSVKGSVALLQLNKNEIEVRFVHI